MFLKEGINNKTFLFFKDEAFVCNETHTYRHDNKSVHKLTEQSRDLHKKV